MVRFFFAIGGRAILFAAQLSRLHSSAEKRKTNGLYNIRELTKFAEHEMHEVVLSCTRARRQMLAAMPTLKSVLH